MKQAMLVGLAMAMTLTFGVPGLHAQPRSTPAQAPGWYCPWMGGGNGAGRCMGGRSATVRPYQEKALSKDQAKQLLEDYLAKSDNPNLRVGDITDKGNVFEATILAKDGTVVQKIQVDKNSGWFRNVS